MKYKPKDYARGLVEAMIGGKKDLDASKIVKNFVKLLKKDGQMGKVKEILALSENLFIKKTGRRKVTIETARKLKAKQKDLVESIAQKGDIVEEKINPELLAGIRIKIDDEQLDMSMLNKINNLFSK